LDPAAAAVTTQETRWVFQTDQQQQTPDAAAAAAIPAQAEMV
jgi:hypothetical protein